MTLFDHPKYAPHGRQHVPKGHLGLGQPTRHLYLNAGEHGHTLAHHVGRDLNLGPPTQIGPALGGCVKRSRLGKDDKFGGAVHGLTCPAHPGVDAEQALVGREGRQDFPYAVLLTHV